MTRSYGYIVSSLGKPPATFVSGLASKVAAAEAAASRFDLTDSELKQLYLEGFLYLREPGPHSTELTNNCITLASSQEG